MLDEQSSLKKWIGLLVPITTNVVSLNPVQMSCTWYNIMW